jgi:primary-amine oxidase
VEGREPVAQERARLSDRLRPRVAWPREPAAAQGRLRGFIEHALWVTACDADERYAAGDTPNQNPGEPGLPRFVADNASIVNGDIVLWHTLTFHHVTAAEDYPVLPREHASFQLKPHNFFDRNPALDLRRAPFEVTP